MRLDTQSDSAVFFGHTETAHAHTKLTSSVHRIPFLKYSLARVITFNASPEGP